MVARTDFFTLLENFDFDVYLSSLTIFDVLTWEQKQRINTAKAVERPLPVSGHKFRSHYMSTHNSNPTPLSMIPSIPKYMHATTKIATQTTATADENLRASMFLLDVRGSKIMIVTAKLIHYTSKGPTTATVLYRSKKSP